MAYGDDLGFGDNDARSEMKRMQGYIHDLGACLDQQEKSNQYLQATLRIEVENSKKIKESANKMQYAMESKELFVGHQDCEDVVYSRFQTLVGHVKTWSVPFAQGRPRLSSRCVLMRSVESHQELWTCRVLSDSSGLRRTCGYLFVAT